jgi:CRP/FNR family transcriptional regulator/CRP/FNR family cyclic AMP-dependent transcriptional regulator
LNHDQIEALASIASVADYDGGDVLMRQFDRSRDLLIIMSGSARVNSFSGDKLVEVGPGSVLGEIALVDEQPRSATVVSLGGTRAARIPGDQFREILEKNPMIAATIYQNLGKVVCARLRTANLSMDSQLARA